MDDADVPCHLPEASRLLFLLLCLLQKHDKNLLWKPSINLSILWLHHLFAWLPE